MLTDMLAGVRVVEVASYQLVPASTAVLAEFGADVVKVEPLNGDPQRRLRTESGAPSPSMDQTNRGKRSIALDVYTPEGRAVLQRLIMGADVFATNLREPVCARLRIRERDLREEKPSLIYARGTALGQHGPDAGRPGFDITAYWARGGVGNALTPPGAAVPTGQRPGFGDKQGAMYLAFGIAAALLRRDRTGVGALVETSLLSVALWNLSSDIVFSQAAGRDVSAEPVAQPGPLNTTVRTSDGRWLRLQLMDGQQWWPELASRLGRPELATDSRFATVQARRENADACGKEVAAAIAAAPLHEWRTRFEGASFPWEVNQNLDEVMADPQVTANDYVPTVRRTDDEIRLVRAPIRFDSSIKPLPPAPALGEHTDAVLGEVGLSGEEVETLRRANIVA